MLFVTLMYLAKYVAWQIAAGLITKGPVHSLQCKVIFNFRVYIPQNKQNKIKKKSNNAYKQSFNIIIMHGRPY